MKTDTQIPEQEDKQEMRSAQVLIRLKPDELARLLELANGRPPNGVAKEIFRQALGMPLPDARPEAPILESIRAIENQIQALQPTNLAAVLDRLDQKRLANDVQRLANAPKLDIEALKSTLEGIKASIEALASKPDQTVDLAPVLDAIVASETRHLQHTRRLTWAWGIGSACVLVLGIALWANIAAHRDPQRDQQAADEMTALKAQITNLQTEITALQTDQDTRLKLVEGAALKLVDIVQPAPKPAQQPPAQPTPLQR